MTAPNLTALFAAAGMIVTCMPLGAAAQAPAARLQSVIDSVADTAPLDRAHWGVEIADRATGTTIAGRNARRHFVPASNNKLVIGAVALAELGPEYVYRTPVIRVGAAAAPEALVVVGRGDPSMSARYFPTEYAALDSMADSIAAAGVKQVRNLVIDASWFDRTREHPGWEGGDLAWGYGSPVEAFGAGEASVRFELLPGTAAGSTARINLIDQPSPIVLRNDVTTGAAGSSLDVGVTRAIDSDTVIISGSIALGADPDTTRVAVPEPARHGGLVLAAKLRERGIAVDDVEVVYDTAAARALRKQDNAEVLFRWQSPPLAAIVEGFMKPSRNWHPETVLKTIAAEREGQGSWRAGLAIERRYLIDRAGIDSTAFSLSDASGLSASNLLAPRMIVDLLRHADAQPWGPAFRATLPEPGEDIGTLSNRLRDYKGRIEAKTGTIANVVTLSGYLRTDSGRELVFSIMTNATGVSSSRVRAGMDRIIAEAASLR